MIAERSASICATVAGLGRSGHSAVANWLRCNGHDVTDGLLNLGFGNPHCEHSEILNVYVIRDIRNWIASRYKSDGNLDYVSKFVGTWDALANGIRHGCSLPGPWRPVVFGKWFSDPCYRSQLFDDVSGACGVKPTFEDRGIELIPAVSPARGGPGSSFDGMDYNGKAQQMKVMERYKQVEWTDEMNRICEPRLKISEEICGF